MPLKAIAKTGPDAYVLASASDAEDTPMLGDTPVRVLDTQIGMLYPTFRLGSIAALNPQIETYDGSVEETRELLEEVGEADAEIGTPPPK